MFYLLWLLLNNWKREPATLSYVLSLGGYEKSMFNTLNLSSLSSYYKYGINTASLLQKTSN